MAIGDNNPRVFAQTVALDAWRTPFDGERGEADLHIDIVFDEEGRVGGEGAPIRFRLSLKRAEVRVIRDSENIIEIKRNSVRRAELPKPGKLSYSSEQTAHMGGKLGVELSPHSANLSVKAESSGEVKVTKAEKRLDLVPAMEVRHWPTDTGYSFKVAPTHRSKLSGQPWDAGSPVMKLHDTGFKRKRGEPPEVRIEIHCLREDLIIEDVAFVESSFPDWMLLPRRKQIAVEQYIKDELARVGMPCGNIDEEFSRIILADVVPAVES